jgi:hypothetical protein
MRARKMHQPNASTGGKRSVFDSPPRRPQERRPRRNSESSALEREKPMTEEEKKQRDTRRRERERRHREKKDKDGRPSKKLDLIDQLDATSIYGMGCKSLMLLMFPSLKFLIRCLVVFHHDGPFDALNPHRNRHGSRRAPMEAFPKDSLNMSLGGAGPLNPKPDHSTLMGNHDDEAFLDYNKIGNDRRGYQPSVRKGEIPVFDPVARGSIVHGDETMGLGTSTFLEGTPAARTVIQRRDAEMAQETQENGMKRSKSLAQRIRGVRAPRSYNNIGRVHNGDGSYGPRSGELPSASGSAEGNPFFNEFDKNEELISVKRTDDRSHSPRSPDRAPPHRGLERRATTDSLAHAPDAGAKPQGSGLLARVKSLKGGRRQQRSEDPPPYGAPPAHTPGTAM